MLPIQWRTIYVASLFVRQAIYWWQFSSFRAHQRKDSERLHKNRKFWSSSTRTGCCEEIAATFSDLLPPHEDSALKNSNFFCFGVERSCILFFPRLCPLNHSSMNTAADLKHVPAPALSWEIVQIWDSALRVADSNHQSYYPIQSQSPELIQWTRSILNEWHGKGQPIAWLDFLLLLLHRSCPTAHRFCSMVKV